MCLEDVRRQRVQTRALTRFPAITTVAAWMLGMKRRRVLTFEWLTLLPATGFLPQMAQC